MKLIICCLFVLMQFANREFTQESTRARILRISIDLDQALSQRKQKLLPTILYKAELDANARYENDTIWIGQIQAEFQTDDDWMSIIYHEYWHYLHEGKFAIGRDNSGQILQWYTDQWYTYVPTEYRIKRSMQQYETSLKGEDLSFANREYLLKKMRETLSQSQELPFIYAPSNLSLEEIQAYKAQLSASDTGLYHLSTAARNAILERIAQQQDTYQRRKAYEMQEGLGPDGNALKK